MEKIKVILGFSTVPDNNTCEGENISPKIEVQGLDAASKALAVIVEDPDAPSGAFTHWAAWNIEPMQVIPEGIPRMATITKPISAVQGANNFGQVGYLGPCPPPGRPHKYIFRILGLDKMLDVRPGASRKELEAAMRGHVVQQGEAVATYGR